MSYKALIDALLEEGTTKSRAILDKTRTEADRIISDASAAADALAREAEREVLHEAARHRKEILGRAALAARHALLQAKHEVLEAVWRRVIEISSAMAGSTRAQALRALLDELLAAAPAGSVKVVIDEREQRHLEPYLKQRGISFERQNRDDLLLGVESEGGGARLRSSLMSRLAKAKPDLIVELNRLLFAEHEAKGREQEAVG